MLEVQATLTTNFRALVFQRLRVTQRVPDYKKNVRCLDVKYFFLRRPLWDFATERQENRFTK